MRAWCLVILAWGVGCAPTPTGRLEEFELESAAVGDGFKLFVRLPPEYETESSLHFPLVVQLDANLPVLQEFSVTANAASELESNGSAAPVIVVGVGYRDANAAQRLRLRDFALPMENETFRATWSQTAPDANAPAFYAFLRDELLPELATRYRLRGPAQTALFGHSMGGLFTAYAATRHDEAPLFSTYVAASPSLFWDDAQVIHRFDAQPDFVSPATLVLTDGSIEGPEMSGFVDELDARLRSRATLGLRLETRRFEAGHLGTTEPSFRAGLQLAFPAEAP